MDRSQVFDSLRDFADELAFVRQTQEATSVAPQLRQIEKFMREAIYQGDLLVLSNIPLHARRVVQFSDSEDVRHSVQHINDFVSRLLKKHKNLQ